MKIKCTNPATKKLWYDWMREPVVFDDNGLADVAKSVAVRLAKLPHIEIVEEAATAAQEDED
jgi:hypothetical protein